MNPLTGRLLGYVFLSLFTAFAAGPYTAQRTVSLSGPVVFLSAVALSQSPPRSACRKDAIHIHEATLKSFPMIQEAVDRLSHWPMEVNQVSLYGGNLPKFMEQVLGRTQRTFCFAYSGRYFKLTWLLIRDMGTLYLVGLASPPAVPVLSKSNLSQYPQTTACVQGLEQAYADGRSTSDPPLRTDRWRDVEGLQREMEMGRVTPSVLRRDSFYKRIRTQIPMDEWNRLTQDLGVTPERAAFRTGGYLILGASQVVSERVRKPIGWFKIARYGFAVLFLALGLWAMRGIYRKRPGIHLNPRWSAIAGDGIFILFSGFGAYCLIEYAMSQGFHMTSFMNEDVVRGMCAIGYLPATAFFALFSANQFSQSVEVSRDGLTLHYPGDVRELKWEDIKGFDRRGSYTVVGRGGTMIPRKIQTKLVILTNRGEMTLVEPGYRKTKHKLISTIKENAPDRLQPDLEEIRKAW